MANVNSNGLRNRFKDLTGKRFGKWTVIAETAKHPSRSNAHWICRCECGTEKTLNGSNLTRSQNPSRSCFPCSQRQHGMEGTPEYVVWQKMKQRCYNPNCKDFPRYGQRGITVSNDWMQFSAFFSDMGKRPSPKHTLERKDNDLGYSKENCKWATWAEQSRNKRSNRLITAFGKTQCLADWAIESELRYKTLQSRIRKGWSIERALTEPVKDKS